MKLDPDTTLAGLLAAIPSSARVLKKLGIVSDGNESKTLKQVSADRGIEFELFLQAMNEIDWNQEAPAKEDVDKG